MPDASGLSSEIAQQLLLTAGRNELSSGSKNAVVKELIPLFSNPLVLILLAAAGVSFFLGQKSDAALIFVIVSVSVTINFVQTYSSNQTIEKLRSKVALTATVMRDGAWKEIPRAEIVPGDVIKLKAGELVPADARIIASKDLHVNEASLTGESLPVEKIASDASCDNNIKSLLYLGSAVVSGTATASVTATGNRTTLGALAAQLVKKAPETEFDRGTRRFGILILKTVLFLVSFVFLVCAVQHRNPIESLLFAVALAVGLTPEFLPMISTVTLGQGAIKMAKDNVVVKHLPAIQNFGSMDILCTDKTGTLTAGKTTVESYVDVVGKSNERVLLLAYLNSMHETGVATHLNAAIKQAGASNPLDNAILEHGHPSLEGYEKLDEIPFDFERRRLSVVMQANEERTIITKGAPESIFSVVTHCEIDGIITEISPTQRAQFTETFESLCANGLMVLAVAWKNLETKDAYTAADEKDLTLVGFITFMDPPLPDSAVLIQDLKNDGVRVVLLTGDHELAAKHVCKQVGIEAERIITGAELDATSDSALAQLVENFSVYARLKPAQKHRIILALKSRGHVVGFLGDGINDAPSLHAADVGISVANATDVAKEAAEIILLQPGLGVIHTGVLEGRRALANVLKYLLMGTSSNFGNMFSMAGAAVFLPFLPMLPTQILLNNLMYDVAQLTIPTDTVDSSFIAKPRKWDIGLIQKFMLFVGPVSSLFDFLTFYILLKVFHADERLFHTGWFIESLATQTLVLFVIRTSKSPWKSKPSLPLTINTLVIVVLALALPFSPLAAPLGFTALPLPYFAVLLIMLVAYLLAVEAVKQKLMKSFNTNDGGTTSNTNSF